MSSRPMSGRKQKGGIMDLSKLLWPVIAGLCFGTWPLIMKSSGLSAIMAAFVLTVVSLLVYLPFLKGEFDQVALLKTGIILAVVSGLLNGIGTIAFQKMIGGKDFDITQVVLMVIIIQIVITAVGGRLFYDDLFTVKKAIGIPVAGLAAYLLVSK